MYHVTDVLPFVPVIAIDFFGLNGCSKLSNFSTTLSVSFTIICVIFKFLMKVFVINVSNPGNIISNINSYMEEVM